MAWYAYCVAEKQAFPELIRHRKPVPIENLTGIQGNQVFLYPASELAVVVSEHTPSTIPQAEHARDHARVIAGCFGSATVLPFRFGTVFANDELLRRSIRSNGRQFAANLQALHGKSEMHIKLTLDDCCREQMRELLSMGVGAKPAYLSDMRETAVRQRERQTRARSVSMQLNRMFLPLEEEISCRTVEGGRLQLEVSHLISSRLVERYVNKFATAREQMRECQLQLSGPWPPYHFVHSLTRSVAPVPAAAAPLRAISA